MKRGKNWGQNCYGDSADFDALVSDWLGLLMPFLRAGFFILE